MSKVNAGEPTQETQVVLVAAEKRSFVAQILEVSFIEKGGKFESDTMAVTVKNMEAKEIPLLVFIPCDFLAKAKAKRASLIQGNIIDITVENHEAFKTGFIATQNGVVDTFMTPHKVDKKDAYVVHIESSMDDYRDILKQKNYSFEECNYMIEKVEKYRAMNAMINESTKSESEGFGGLR